MHGCSSQIFDFLLPLYDGSGRKSLGLMQTLGSRCLPVFLVNRNIIVRMI